MDEQKIGLDSLILLEARAYKTIRTYTKKILKPHDVNLSEWLALLVVEKKDADGVALTEIAETLVVPSSQATLITKKLEDRQLIKIKPSQEDNRYKHVFVTARGKGLLGEIRKDLNMFFNPVDKAQVDPHVDIINKVIESLAR